MPTPYHVRLAISQYGEQFRAELFTEDLGDTEGDLLTELPPSIAEWVPYLSQGADLPPDAARQLGKDLFAALLGHPENAKKWAEVLAHTGRKNQPIRLLIDATTEAVRDLPYGLLCEPHDDWFLFRGNKHPVEFVRIIRRCSPRPLKFRDRLRVLVAVAEPSSADVPAYDAPRRLQQLAAGLSKGFDLVVCGPNGPKPLPEISAGPEAEPPATFAPFTKTTRDALKKALTDEYDVFHLLAHGHGPGVLLCAPDGAPAEVTGSELAEWCGAGRTGLAFLQVCKAGQTAGRGGFGGVAQQLLSPRGGNLAAVVASTFPLDAEHSTGAAVGFYTQLAAGVSPEEALSADRPEGDWCWAFLELWARPGALGGGTQRAAFQFVSPYRGLSSFGEQDADLFFGRKSEVAELMQILRAEPAVAVVGDSGSGKTSLLQAGLVHAVRREGLAGSDKWKLISLRPGYRPAQALLAALTGATAEPTPEALAAALRTDARPLFVVFDQFEEVFTLARDKAEVQMVTAALADAVANQRDRFRLVLGMRSEFLGQAASVPRLSRLIRRPWVLRPPGADDMRAIVGGPAEHCGYTFQGALADGNPAHAAPLLDRILADPLLARAEGGLTAAPLPLLQFGLERLWLKAVEKGATEFTHAAYDELGGMGKAIAQHAEAVFQASATATEAGPAARAVAEQIITALVSARGTRQPRAREALQAETGSPEAARGVIDYLVGERLLTVRTDPEDMTKSLVDLAHEALIQNWDRLRGWLAEDPQGRAMREEFRTAAEKWEAGFAGVQPKSRYGLPGADVARNYLAWIEASSPRLAPVQQEFAQALRDMLARQRRRTRLVMAALGALALASSMLALYADFQAGKARTSAAAAEKNEKAANKSAAEANDAKEKAEASEAQARAEKRSADEKAATLALEKGVQICEQGRPRLGLLSIGYALRLCPPDAHDLRRVILTNLASWGPHLMCLDEVRTLPRAATATDRAGKYALLARVADKLRGPDSTVLVPEFQLYEIDTERPAGPPFQVQWNNPDGTFKYRQGGIEVARLLPSGLVLFTGQGTSSVWDAATGKPLGAWIDHGPGLANLRPDGKLVAGCNGQGDVQFYDLDAKTGTWHPRPVKFPHMGRVNELTFSADGRYLVTGCGRRADAKMDAKLDKGDDKFDPNAPPEGAVHLYEVGAAAADTTARKWRRAVPGIVTCVQISPDLSRVTGGGFELRSWKLNGDPLAGDTRYSPESTDYLEFDPKEPSSFIACNPSGALQILHADENIRVSGERLSPQGWLAGVGFRPDGRVFTANGDGTVRIWNRPHHLGKSRNHGRLFEPDRAEALLCVAFAPNGKSVALGARTGTVFVYDLERPGAAPRQFKCAYTDGERRPVTQVRFSTDGVSTDSARLIAHDQWLNVFVFDLTGTDPTPVTAKGARGRPLGVADDGRTAVFLGPTLTPYVIGKLERGADVPAGPKVFPGGSLASLRQEADNWFLFRGNAVAFGPDRSRVALLNTEGAVHVFDLNNIDTSGYAARVGAPLGHLGNDEQDGIHALEFCPLGECLLTRSPKGRTIWSARTGEKIDALQNRIGVQVARFSPSGKYVVGGTNFSLGKVWTSRGADAVPLPLVHAAQVWGVAADARDERIITASFDRSARVWDRATGRPLTPPLMHRLGVSEATFSPNGALALTGSWDGTARLWPLPGPLPDEPERLNAWIETMTGMRLGPNADGALLKPDEWRQRKRELDALGGPPIR